MKKHILIIAVAAALGLSACERRGSDGSVTGPHGEKLSVGVPEKVTVQQGRHEKFSVAVNREKIEGPVQINFENLPAGVSIAEKELTIPDNENQIFVIVEATEEARVVKQKEVRVTATLGEWKTSKKFLLDVNESLEGKAERQKAFAQEMEKRLEAAKKQLDDTQKDIMDLREDVKAELLKQAGERSEDLDLARKKYDEFVSTPAENWERHKTELESYITTLERNVQNLRKNIEKAK